MCIKQSSNRKIPTVVSCQHPKVYGIWSILYSQIKNAQPMFKTMASWETVQLLTCLQAQGPTFNTHHPCKRLRIVSCACSPGTGEQKRADP